VKNDPGTKHIAEDMDHAELPRGRAASQPSTATVMNAMLFKHTRYPNAAKQFLAFMMESEQYDPWMNACLGYWVHPLKNYGQSGVWSSDPKLAIFRDTMENRFWSGYSGPITQASGTVASEYILVQMCAAVASGQASPQEAAREAERRTKRFYRS
jgi:multiple sugar transport system substrate-binding protein